MTFDHRTAIPAILEVGSRRTFAWADDWPGWCRSGRDEAAALAALAAAGTRYAPVADAAGLALPWEADTPFDVVERVTGDATTDFGAPGKVVTLDRAPLTRVQAARQVALLEAAWSTFDAVVSAAPLELRRGPRGGGRDRDQVAGHVVRAETAYARVMGLKLAEPDPADPVAIAAQRASIVAVLRLPSDGLPLAGKRWPPRTAARRIAWHVLDHAWEIEDRMEAPAG